MKAVRHQNTIPHSFSLSFTLPFLLFLLQLHNSTPLLFSEGVYIKMHNTEDYIYLHQGYPIKLGSKATATKFKLLPVIGSITDTKIAIFNHPETVIEFDEPKHILPNHVDIHTSQDFMIVRDHTGAERIVSGDRCVEYDINTGYFFKNTCQNIETQLFDFINDVFSESRGVFKRPFGNRFAIFN
ncbi:hypothetical protein CWI36_1576p0010 [Hamiltosporidium magnivora]|uniref:Uncharacterized protein n=1 Tax=Hamiltosporidium magnivora TaxID=148818 RepID=A0A4Q9L000_9MICR|nr:hypothetical protein CWI36_1576p0010 [Hamiltosporidium magnivora]